MKISHEDALFALAVQKTAEERPVFLDAICADDTALRQRLEALLAAHDISDSFMADSVQETRPALSRSFGNYELQEEIARGGMGVVFKARQVSLNRIVAVKMILAGDFSSPAIVERFQTEAEVAARLEHPNLVPIYEIGEHEGQHYFSMRFLEGGTLTEAMAREKFGPEIGGSNY